MRMRDRIHIVENAVGIAELGRLADRAAVIALRGPDQELKDEDREVLERACHLLENVKEFSTPTLPTRTSLQAMAPLYMLDETLDAVSTASETAETTDFLPAVERLIEAVMALLDHSASNQQASEVATFFDRLSAITLSRSSDLARPNKDRYRRWIAKTQSSSAP